MSEAIPGIPRAEPAKLREAAVVVLFRRRPDGVEVFWLRRSPFLAFAPGYFAFPGGGVDPDDRQVEIAGVGPEEAVLRVAATRELFEEAGVLLAQGSERIAPDRLTHWRRELIEGRARFSQFLGVEGVGLVREHLWDAGRWITPPAMPKRFDTYFFLAEARSQDHGEVWMGESTAGGWIRPEEAIQQWEVGETLLHPPTLYALRTLRDFQSAAQVQSAMRAPPHCPAHIATRIELQQGIHLFPQETPTLPPATHTNAYVLGTGELLIVDPGSSEVRQYARLIALIAGLQAEGKRPIAVVLTHHHADHVGGAEAVSQRLKVPIWCHGLTAQRLGLRVSRLLNDGEVISLKGAPAMQFRVLHTPGHARGHVCLVDERSRAAIVGDMVAGIGTIVIDPPEGDMSDYLEQLKRLRAYPISSIYPAHGPAIAEGPAKIDEYLTHREQREGLVFDAVESSGSTIQSLVAKAYADVPSIMHPIAERSAQAILIKLVREGRVIRREDRYFPAPAAPRPVPP